MTHVNGTTQAGLQRGGKGLSKFPEGEQIIDEYSLLRVAHEVPLGLEVEARKQGGTEPPRRLQTVQERVPLQ